MRSSDEYYTPQWIFQALNIKFDLDVSAPKGGVPWLPADNHYSIEDDGLTKDWYGKVWMNPPFSQSTPWVNKFIEHGNGIALVPFAKSAWFHTLWNVAGGIVPLTSKLKFEHRDKGTQSIFMSCFLASMGTYCTDYLHQSNIGKVR
jgi:hypothetical protein